MDVSNQFKVYYGKELAQNVNLPSQITSRYSVNACLTSSGDKEVYLLESHATKERVVARRLSLDKSEANRTEYDLLKGLEHPKVPKAIELLEEEGYSYFIRSYIPGASLHQWVAARGVASERESVRIIIQLCDILTYLHTRKPLVIHRDIKPQNIILDPSGTIYLIDFDISRKYDPEAERDTMFMGTSATAPPEQYGYGQTDARSDIYSLGILLIFLYTGRYERTALTDMPQWLRKIAETCTQFAPKDRYVSASQLKTALIMRGNVLLRRIVAGIVAVCAIAGAFYIGRSLMINNTSDDSLPSVETSFIQTGAAEHQTSVAEDDTVTFASTVIGDEVREKLGKEPGEPVTLSELQSITELNIIGIPSENLSMHIQFVNDQAYQNGKLISRGDITVLTDLTLMKSLTDLTLVYQRIDNIEPLQNLHLRSLVLVGNYISDLTPLSDMKTLQTLVINNNPVSDLSPLISLQRLTMLGIQFGNVTDISVLKEIPGLIEIDMHGSPCTDYSALLELPMLSFIDISQSSAQDVAVISGNPSIKELIAINCGLTSLEGLQLMPNLERLDLSENEVSDLSGVVQYQSLKSLILQNNPVDDLSPLTALPVLEDLDLRGADVDLSPLLRISSFQRIICSPDMQSRIDAIQDEAEFEIEILDLP